MPAHCGHGIRASLRRNLPDQPICALIRNAQPAAQVRYHHTKSPDVPRRASASLGTVHEFGRDVPGRPRRLRFCCGSTRAIATQPKHSAVGGAEEDIAGLDVVVRDTILVDEGESRGHGAGGGGSSGLYGQGDLPYFEVTDADWIRLGKAAAVDAQEQRYKDEYRQGRM